MIPGAFAYHRPTSVKEAISLLAQFGDDGRALAGGHSLIPMMKLRLAAPEHLIDLAGVAELKGIHPDGGDIVIGAMTTQHDLIASELLSAKIPLLCETSLVIADPQVRYVGTLGGNVANGDPGNDMPAVMMCLGASYHVAGKTGERRIAAREFYRGAYVTRLEPGEIVTGIRIPVPPTGHGCGGDPVLERRQCGELLDRAYQRGRDASLGRGGRENSDRLSARRGNGEESRRCCGSHHFAGRRCARAVSLPHQNGRC